MATERTDRGSIADSITRWPVRTPAIRRALVTIERVCPDCGSDITTQSTGTGETRRILPAQCECGWKEESAGTQDHQVKE